jgi:hypothetical protein
MADEVLEALLEIRELMAGAGEDRWATSLADLATEAEGTVAGTDFRQAFARKCLTLLGGMGSLNDVVLYRNGRMLGQENDQFSRLRDRLYVALKREA